MVGSRRNFGLDVTRAVSIILVLISHKFTIKYEIGIFGVQIFFVLSGFLIGQILFNSLNKQNFGFWGFWQRRWFRTLPLYYLVLLLKVVFIGNPYGWKIIVYFMFLQANILGIDYFPVSWSLVVEEWFYIFLPVCLFFLYKQAPKKSHLSLLVAVTLLILFCRVAYNYYKFGNIVYQFDCLLLGVILSQLKIFYPDVYQKLNNPIPFLFGLLMAIYLLIDLGTIDHVNIYSTYERVIWYFLVSLAISLTVPFLELSNFLNITLKSCKPLYHILTWTSILTYALYLFHPDIYYMTITDNIILNDVLQFALLGGISYFTYVIFEHPFTSLRDNFSARHYLTSIKKSFRLSTNS